MNQPTDAQVALYAALLKPRPPPQPLDHDLDYGWKNKTAVDWDNSHNSRYRPDNSPFNAKGRTIYTSGTRPQCYSKDSLPSNIKSSTTDTSRTPMQPEQCRGPLTRGIVSPPNGRPTCSPLATRSEIGTDETTRRNTGAMPGSITLPGAIISQGDSVVWNECECEMFNLYVDFERCCDE